MSDVLTDSPEHLRLGIDLDGVVADFNGGWIARYNRDFGASLHPDQVIGWDELHALTAFRSMAEFWAWARGDGQQHLPRHAADAGCASSRCATLAARPPDRHHHGPL